MDPHSAYWKQEAKLPKTGIRLKGHSRSTEMTCFYMPDYDLYWDAGVHSYYSCDSIWLTHGHGDHFQAINGILKSQNPERSNKPIAIYCPSAIANMVRAHIESYFRLNANNPHLKIHKIVTIIGVEPGQRIPLRIKNRDYIMDIFKCYHSVPTVGFGLTEVREKLNEDLSFLLSSKSISQVEIVNLKKAGQSITHKIEVPLICYLGDTTHEVFKDAKIFDYPTIITECTFFDPADLREAIKRKHTHWDNLVKVINEHQENTFTLIHQSLRYSDHDIAKFINGLDTKGERPKNMIVWTDHALLTSEENKCVILTPATKVHESSSASIPLSKSMPNLQHHMSDACCSQLSQIDEDHCDSDHPDKESASSSTSSSTSSLISLVEGSVEQKPQLEQME